MLPLVPWGIALVFFAWWLRYRSGYSWGWDEANILLSAREVARGVRLYDPMWWNYPPVFLWMVAALVRVADAPVLAARALALVWSSLALVVTAGLARRAYGDVAAVFTVLLLAVTPSFVLNGRAVMADIPTATLALLALWMLLRGRDGQTYIWVTAGAVVFTLAVFSKFTALPFVLAVGVALLSVGPATAWYRRGGVALATSAATVALILVQLPLVAFVRQAILFHAVVGDRNIAVLGNAVEIGRFLGGPRGLTPAPMLLLALCSLPALHTTSRRQVALVSIWTATLGALGTLLFYTPLYSHHVVLLTLPLAVLGGVGSAWLLTRVAAAVPTPWRSAATLVGCLMGVMLLFGFYRPDWTYMSPARPEEENKSEDARLLASELRNAVPNDALILSDDPMIPLLSGHSPPPAVVNTSSRRFVRDGIATADLLVPLLEAAPPEVIVFWTDRLLELPGFLPWVQERYIPTWVYDDKQRAYQHAPAPSFRQTATFGDSLTLHGYDLEPLAAMPGRSATLTLDFAVGAGVSETTTYFVHVEGDDERIAGIDWRVRMGDVPIEDWLPGDRIRTKVAIPIPKDAEAGQYLIHVGAYNDTPDRSLGKNLLSRPLFVGTTERLFAQPEPERNSRAEWPGIAHLLGADVAASEGELQVGLYWQALAHNAPDAKVFVQLLDDHNTVVAQSDTVPAAGLRPIPGWVPDEVIVDSHRLAVPTDLPADDYTLIVGLYDPNTTKRFPVETPNHTLPADAAPLGTVALP